MVNPCKDCERKGCGSYHDQCAVYQDYVARQRHYNKEKLKFQEEEYYYRFHGRINHGRKVVND